MSPFLVFLILLGLGAGLVFLGSKGKGKEAAILVVIGIVLAIIGGYGVFTAFL